MRASSGSVQRDLVVVHEVDRLNDINLAVVRPDGAFGPEGGPNGAAVGNVQEVDDPDAAPVVEVLAGDAYLRQRRSESALA